MNNPWVGGGGAVRAYEIYRRLAERHDITIVCGAYPGAKITAGTMSGEVVGSVRTIIS
jgi:hypothetical protein